MWEGKDPEDEIRTRPASLLCEHDWVGGEEEIEDLRR